MGVAGTFRATVSYDGTDFSGWQVQAGRRTVQGALEEALSAVLESRTAARASSRTLCTVRIPAWTCHPEKSVPS